MIVDSSVWIDHFTGRIHAAARLLQSALRRGDEILVLPVILQEVLQGTKDRAQFERYTRLLSSVPLARVPRLRRVALAAADCYARLRWRGVTVSSTDCFITASAIASRMPLLTADADFLHIADVQPRLRLLLPVSAR